MLGDVMRDICLLGIAGVYRSAAESLASRREGGGSRRPVAREHLRRANGCDVVLSIRYGRVRIGRLRLGTDHVTLHQLVQGIPCCHRFDYADVVSCYVYDNSGDEWDEPTQPSIRRRVGNWIMLEATHVACNS
ncbi:hypothetical protein [Haliangium sp.]|uniref:hypothetical protein n=1 Tax=Haliangium sp. TaxID=2663208 RepID=UPI003D0E3685